MIPDVETIEGPYWDQRFAAMPIPGDDCGIAVLKEECLRFSFASIGCEGATCTRLKMCGDPLRVVSREVMTKDEFLAQLRVLDAWPFSEGLIRTPETLDGECFLVKRLRGVAEFRLVICNPRLLGASAIEEFAHRLDAFIGRT